MPIIIVLSLFNKALDPPQPLARSFSFVQQQQQALQKQQSVQQQPQSRRRDRDDDAMHERYLIGQGHDQSCISNSSHSSVGGEETEDPNILDDGKKKRSND